MKKVNIKRKNVMKRKVKNEHGAIVMEATIAFTAFIFLIFIIYSIVDICYIQAKMGIALNESAIDMSQYSYLYYKFGIDSVDDAISGAAAESRARANDTLAGVDSLMTAIGDVEGSFGSGGDSVDFDRLKEALDKTDAATADMKKNIGDYADALASDPMGFAKGMGMLALSEGSSAGKSLIAQAMGKAFMKKNLKDSSSGSADDFLNHYQKKGGMDGLHFDGTEFLVSTDGESSENLRLTCTYQVEVVNLLDTDIALTFCQSASTDVWGNGVSSK